MVKCSICGKIIGSRYFSVPQDERRREQWTEICQIELQPKDIVCNDHFLPTDLIVGAKRVRLMPSAVPSIGIVSQKATHFIKEMENENDDENEDEDDLTYASDEHGLYLQTDTRLMKQMVNEKPFDINNLYHDDDDGLTYASDEHGLHSQTENKSSTMCDGIQSQTDISNHGFHTQMESSIVLEHDFGGDVFTSTTGVEFDSQTHTDCEKDKISIRKCCICGTKQHSGNLFKAPKGMELLWSKKLGVTIRKDSRVCGKHFRLDDFRKNTKLRIIKNFAVPTLHLPHTYITNPSEVVTMNFINEELYDETVHHTMDGFSSTSDSCNESNSSKQVLKDVNDEDSYNYKSRAVQTGTSTAQTCGFVQITMNSNVYTLQCIYCGNEFPLWSWTKFVTHMKDNHQAVKQTNVNTDELYNDDTYIDKENYIFVIKSKDQRAKTGNIQLQPDSAKMSNNSAKTIQFQTDETVPQLPLFDEVVPSLPLPDNEDLNVIGRLNDYDINTTSDDDDNDDGSADASDDDASDPVFKKKQSETCQHSDFCSTDEEDFNLGPRENNLIRFGWTDRNIIVDFLDLLKTYPVLCDKRQDCLEEYDAALEAITKVLNKRWDCGLTDIGVRISLNRIIDWYRQVLIKVDKFKEEYKCKYPEYFKKCEDVLPKPAAVKCALCDNSFLNEVDLQVHQIMIHGKPKFPHKCSECDWLFVDANTLQRHHNDHKEKEQIERFYCSMCNKGFYSRHLLKTHIKLHRVCDVCGKNFRNPVKYQRHRLLHDPPKFKCRLCPKIYHWQERLTEHMKLHRNQRDYICDECGRSFIRRATLYNHKYMLHRGGKATERLKVHNCKICGSQFKSSNELHVHRVKHHLVLEGTIEELTTFRRKNYSRKYKWIVDPEDPTKKRISCELCGNSYAHHSGYYVHSVKMHNLKPVTNRRKRPQYNMKPAKVIDNNDVDHIDDNDIDHIDDNNVEHIDYNNVDHIHDNNMDHFDDSVDQIDDDIIEYMGDNIVDQIDDDDIIEHMDEDLVELLQ